MTTLSPALITALAGRYTIEREIGAGGMATVYLAQDVKHHRRVAVKVLRPEIAATLGAERFGREIEVAAQLQHPHILPLLDSGEAAGFFYYCMPFVEGESLRDRLAHRGELPVHDAVRILVEVTDALAHAHAHGVVHRDIKPDNILMSGRHALVMDFGVAKAVSEATGRQQLTTAGIALGTPAYMAPEQAAADPNLDHRVDIYAVGVLGYELLTGRPPFSGLTPQETLAAHVTKAPEPVERGRPGVSSALSDVLMKCLAKRPSDRWQTADELLAQLEPLATPSGGVTPTATRPITAANVRRRPAGVAVAVGVGVLVLVAAGALLLRSGSPRLLELGRRTQVTLDPGLEIDPALSPDGKLIAYVAGTLGDTRLMVRQVDGGAPVRVAPDIGGGQRLPFWTPDGRRLVFQSPRGIEIVPALGGASRVLIADTRPGVMPGPVSPDGGLFAFVARDSLYAMLLDGGGPRLIGAAPELHSPAWSPDGRWIAYVSGNRQYVATRDLGNLAQSGIWAIPSAGGQAHRLTDDRSLNVSPVWVSDRVLLFVSNRDGGRDVYQVGLSRSGEPAGPPARLTTGLNAQAVSVAAGGGRLAYSVFTERSNVWTIPIPAPRAGIASTTQARAVTAGNQTTEAFDVSPDGQWLAYDSDRSGSQQIYRVRLTGGEPEQLTTDSADHFWPTWSPDGKRIAFHAFRNGHRQVFVMSADGGRPDQITTGTEDMRSPEWLPDGGRLTVAENWKGGYRFNLVTRQADGGWSAPQPLRITVGSDTIFTFSSRNADVSPDGRFLVCDCDGLAVAPIAGGRARPLLPGARPDAVSATRWSADSRLIYYLYSDSTGFTLRAIPFAGGTSQVLVRFDDPTRPWHRFGFRVRDGRFYFTLGDLQSDVWVAEIKK